MAPLLSALHAAGHEIRVATSRRFGPVVHGVGLRHESVGLDWLESALGDAFPDVAQHRHDPHGALVRFVVDVYVRRTAVHFATDTASLIDRWKPALLLHAVNEFGGVAAAEAAGVPHLMVMAGLDNWFDRFGPALPNVDECRRAVGLEPAGGDSAWLGIQPQACTPETAAEWTRRLLTDVILRTGAKRLQAALRQLPSPSDVAASLAERFG